LSASGIEWYAIQVKSRCEKMVAEQLQAKQYEQFLPMYWSRRLWSDRVKVLEMPLFSGYVFCRFEIEKRLSILNTPGVASIVSKGRVPAPVDPQQLNDIRLAVASGQEVKPWPTLEIGEKVRIEVGPLQGAVGTLLRQKSSTQLILGLDLMQRAVAVEVEESWVMPLRPAVPVAIANARVAAASSEAEFSTAQFRRDRAPEPPEARELALATEHP
jgi:transcription antitermination factor NusG